MQLRRLVIVPSLLFAVTIVWSAVALMLVSATISPTSEPTAVTRADLRETRTMQAGQDLNTVNVKYDGAESELGDRRASR